MPDESNLDLLHNINQEIEAFGRVIEEMVIWTHQRDSDDTPDRIDDHLAVISENSGFIAEMILKLLTGCNPEDVMDLESQCLS